MFREAYKIASQFTLPVVLSRRTVGGACSASIGSFVVVNNEGWIVTAAHIFEQIEALSAGEQKFLARPALEAAARANPLLTDKQRREALKNIGFPNKDDTARASTWWGRDGIKLVNNTAIGIPAIDIAIAKIQDFDPTCVSTYPKFKDPSKDYEQGKSLCKLGFPFHDIVPSWDDATSTFGFQTPIPRFPIEGIFTRTTEIIDPNRPSTSYPLRWVETSSPGLRGQSGGPTFDVHGAIWAIQVRTAHYRLGFSKSGEPEQYLNVGLGVHCDTLIGLFNEHGVKFEMTTY